jgi:3-hydroxymyristoyl/3-hydroxydecanoyl-(acyl carrier protein) dehydratase
MSTLYREIEALLQRVSVHADGRITAEITFPESFTGFRGHFPDQAVVPGVCKVLCVLVLLEYVLKRKARLRTIVLAKFVVPVTSREKVTLELRRVKTGDAAERVKALFILADKKTAEVQIEVNYA